MGDNLIASKQASKQANPNCLNTIRLIAAIQVMYGHTIAHLGIDISPWISRVLALFPGVPIFFMMSGFLIWNSVAKSKSFGEYAKRRFVRIYPELWIGVIIEIAVMLLLYEKRIPALDVIVFWFTQSTFLQFWTPSSMRVYGCGTPNGSLWTICTIIQFYIVVWWLRKWLNGKRKRMWVFVIVCSIVCGILLAELYGFLPEVWAKLANQTIFAYLWMFLIGAFIAEFFDKMLETIKKYWWLFIFCAVILMLLGVDISVRYNVFQSICLIVGWIGFAYRFPKFNVKLDISYAIYIYHMIVVNALLAFGQAGSIGHLLIVFGVTCALAYLSTVCVGGKLRKVIMERL